MDIIEVIESKYENITTVIDDGMVDSCSVVYINPETYIHYRGRTHFLKEFDIVRFDGLFMTSVFRLFLTFQCPVKRQSFDFTSLAPKVFTYCVENKKSVFFAGGSKREVEDFVEKITSLYSDLDVSGFINGYESIEEIASAVKDSSADVVILGLGSIKQDIVANKVKDDATCFTCGAFISQTANSDGNDYYPHIINKLNLRWLFRILKEDRVLQRVLIKYPHFLVVFLFDYISNRIKTR